MPKLDLNKINPLTLALLTFVVLGVAVLFARVVFPALVLPTEVTPEASGPQLETIQLQPAQKTNFAGFQFELPDNWTISYALSSDKNFDWKCSAARECQMLIVVNGSITASLKQVVLSTPASTRYAWTGQKKLMDIDVEFAGKTVKMTEERFLTLDSETDLEASADLTEQIFGCYDQFICVNSGLLDTNADTNKTQVAEFKQFLSKLKLTKV